MAALVEQQNVPAPLAAPPVQAVPPAQAVQANDLIAIRDHLEFRAWTQSVMNAIDGWLALHAKTAGAVMLGAGTGMAVVIVVVKLVTQYLSWGTGWRKSACT